MYVNSDNMERFGTVVGELAADVYISKTGTETNVIVWQDPSNDVLLVLSAFADKEELPQLAEKVQKREKE